MNQDDRMSGEILRARFSRIRAHWKTELPRMFAEHEKTGRVHFDPYRLDFVSEMTPIEAAVWADIRCASLPFFPQIPALGYFLDFADPFKKIAIECDGKEWHDAAKDAARDARLAADGWIVYRIPGAKCNRSMRRPYDLVIEKLQMDYTEGEGLQLFAEHARTWSAGTSEGIVDTIGCLHYGFRCPFVEAGLREPTVPAPTAPTSTPARARSGSRFDG